MRHDGFYLSLSLESIILGKESYHVVTTSKKLRKGTYSKEMRLLANKQEFLTKAAGGTLEVYPPVPVEPSDNYSSGKSFEADLSQQGLETIAAPVHTVTAALGETFSQNLLTRPHRPHRPHQDCSFGRDLQPEPPH